MSEVTAYGLTVDPPSGWETRIFRRSDAGGPRAASEPDAPPGPPLPMGAVSLPVAQLGTIPIPADVADFGSDVVDELGASDAFIVLKEFTADSAGDALFATDGLPRRLDPSTFSPSTLQRTIDGQGGFQAFFHESGRAFCLYVVLGSFDARHDVVPRVNDVLAGITIEPATSSS